MRCTRPWAAPVAIVVAMSVGYGCRHSDGASEAAALRQVLAGQPAAPITSVVWMDVREFYRRRNDSLLWVSQKSPSRAMAALRVPNDFDVYLHDTPADALFARQGRALSHGCIRLEEPDALAAYILRDHSEWDAQRVREAMRSGEEKHVKLKDIVPVHIAYFTAWVDEAGGLHFEPDVYGYDAKQFALWPADASPLSGAAEP